jgi:NAD(P)-dependent dehydrogenase (short-subunit alcohol dehydrogenase family)
VNVSSLAGRVPPPFSGVYSASKFALEGASESLHFELHPFGVRVVLVEPGGFETAIESNRRVSARFTEGSPYLDLEKRFTASLSKLPAADARGPAQDVADKIYDAVHDKEPKLRYLVGQDAEMIGGLKKQLSDEQFEQAMRQTLDFWD